MDMAQADSDLVVELIRLSQRKGKPPIRYTTKNLPDQPDFYVHCWNLLGSKYNRVRTPLPTPASSLFTTCEMDSNDAPYKIVVRGYDRFFEIDEMPWTTVRRSIMLMAI